MKKQTKIARGYRLYPKTQKQIARIQKLLNSDSDKAIFTACDYFLNAQLKLKNTKENNLITNS